MRLLYVGQLGVPNSTALHRMQVLERCGAQVEGVDHVPFIRWGGRIVAAPARRSQWGPPLWLFNREILRVAAQMKPEVVWVDKGVWVFPETLQELRARFQSVLVHYTPDPALAGHQSRHFNACIPVYDLLVTTKAYELDEYRRRGAKQLLMQFPAVEPRAHKPEIPDEEERQRFGSDVAFVGHHEPEREDAFQHLRKLGIRLAVWGPGWKQHCRDRTLFQEVYRGDFLSGRAYSLAWGCGKIGLCLLCKLWPDRSTTRTFEIPAAGAFLLAERTDEHLAQFEEGSEAAFFGSPEEMVEKVRYYLAHDAERERVAAAGLARCLADHTYERRLSQALAEVERLRCRPQTQVPA